MKICSRCKKVKPYELFYKDKSCKDGYRFHCKICIKEYKVKNKEKLIIYRKEYFFKNKEKLIKYKKEYNLKNKEKTKEYNLKNKEKQREYNKKYYQSNEEKIKQNTKEYQKNKLQNDSLFKFRFSTRNLISQSFKRKKNNNWSKKTKTENILGCTIEEFRSYIKIKFDKKMTFENYGKWHLDHIIPISYAKTEEEVIKLNHYTNFQPLWAKDNLSKGNKIIYNTQLKLI
jgi:hypothetical protein